MDMYLELLLGYIDKPSYDVNNVYTVYINKEEKKYEVYLNEEYIGLLPLIRKLSQKYPVFDALAEFNEINFEVFYNININKISEELRRLNIDPQNDLISDLIFWESLNLSRVAPLLYDININEIFINGSEYPIYVDHRRYGKLITNIILTKSEVISLIRLIEFIKGEGLDPLRGNMEADLYNSKIHYRLNIDGPQITYGDYFISLRNLRHLTYSPIKLINLGSIDVDLTSILIVSIYSLANIIIAGSPNTGKTTLLNSLLSILPNHIRKVYIEEARESLDLRRYGNHQVFYRLGKINKWSKEEQIIFTLRRSPGYIIIGETLTKHDVEILFYSISLGLNVATTIHTHSIDSLLKRWLIHEEMDPRIICDIDLVVIMKRNLDGNRRYVDGVYTLEYKDNDIKIYRIKEISQRDYGLSILAEKLGKRLKLKYNDLLELFTFTKEKLSNGEIINYEKFIEFIKRSRRNV